MSQEANHPLIGADPELFLTSLSSHSVVPVFGLVGGTKEVPIPVPGLEGYTMQEDGAAFEFNIPPAASSIAFARSIRTALDTINVRVLYPISHSIAVGLSTITLSPEQLALKQAQTIGCSKDYTAYPKDGKHEREPFTAQDLGAFRYSGGHLHVQYNKEAMPEWAAARFMDVFVGLPMVWHDRQEGRRLIYGQPGLYRPKPYGIEYRTLSNAWIFFNRDKLSLLADNVFKFANLTYNQIGIERLHAAFEGIDWDRVHQAIATEDTHVASHMLDKISDLYDLRVNYL